MRTELIRAYYASDEYSRRLRARLEVLSKCEDVLEHERMKAVWEKDPIRFIEDVLFLKLTAFNGMIKPFFLFDYQKDILKKLVVAEDGGDETEILIDKLREMGMTWLIAAYMYWRWLFTRNWSGFILSRTEKEVDDGTADPDSSIFGKLRFFMKHTPTFLIPEGFSFKEKKGTSTDSLLKLLNPEKDTIIVGSSTNANAGRSRRYRFGFIDECFYIDKFLSVWRALQSVCRVKVYVSSVKQGRTAENFKDMCKERGNYITLSWKDHPWKDQQWYDEKMTLAEFDPEVVKEIQVDYSVNPKDQYYPEIRQATIVPIEYDPALPVYMFLDFGKQDLTVLGWAQFTGDYVDILECYANFQKPLDWYIPFMTYSPGLSLDASRYNEVQLKFIAKTREWAKPKAYFGEQAHFMKVMPLNISIAQVLLKNGIRLMCNQYATKYEPRRHATAMLLPKMRFNENSEGVMTLYDAIATSKYTGTNAPVSRETAMKPRHENEIADYRAALENLAVNIPRILKSQRENIGQPFREDDFATNLVKYLRI